MVLSGAKLLSINTQADEIGNDLENALFEPKFITSNLTVN